MDGIGSVAIRFKDVLFMFVNKIRCDKTLLIGVMIAISAIYTIFFALFNGFLYTESLLTLNGDDSFIPDFIEVLWKSYKGTPYEEGSAYSPLVFLFFKLLSFTTPVLSEIDSYIIPITDPRMPTIIALYVVTVAVCLGFAIRTVVQHVNGLYERFVIIFLILFSSSMIWTIERGNIIYMGFALLMYYCFNYGSDDRRKRAVSIICLVLAISIKIYFCVFAILLLRDRQYKRLGMVALLVLVLNIVSIMFFGGFDSISLLISNMFDVNESLISVNGFKTDFINTINIIGMIIEPGFSFDSILLRIVLAGSLILESLLVKDKNISLTAAIFSYVMFTNVSWVYLLILLIIPIALFLKNKDQNNCCVFIILAITMLTFPISFIIPIDCVDRAPYTYLLFSVCYMIISIILGVDGVKRAISSLSRNNGEFKSSE